MTEIFIVGTGSQARYVLENLRSSSDVRVAGLVDLEREENIGKRIGEYEIACALSDVSRFFSPKRAKAIIAYGNTKVKKDAWSFLRSSGYSFANSINSHAYIAGATQIGAGCIINAGAVVMPGSRIGNHVVIHSGSVIEHDNSIADFVNIGPGVTTGGRVTIEEGATLYTGCVIIPKVILGRWSVVGAGATVIRNVSQSTTVVGNPARELPAGDRLRL